MHILPFQTFVFLYNRSVLYAATLFFPLAYTLYWKSFHITRTHLSQYFFLLTLCTLIDLSSTSSSGALDKCQPLSFHLYKERHGIFYRSEWDTICEMPSTVRGTQGCSVTVSYQRSSRCGAFRRPGLAGHTLWGRRVNWHKCKCLGSLPSLWWQTQQQVCSCWGSEVRIYLVKSLTWSPSFCLLLHSTALLPLSKPCQPRLAFVCVSIVCSHEKCRPSS